MYRRRVLLVALVAFALVAASCSKGDSKSSEGLEGSQPDSTTVANVLDNLKSEVDNGLLTDSMKTVFPNLDLPSESTDAINKLSGELTDLAKTEPKKAACAGVSVLEGIVSGITEAATELSSDNQAVVDKALKPIEAGLSELTNQKDYKSNCAGASNDSILPNQAALITQLLKPIVGDWNSSTLICDVVHDIAMVLIVAAAAGMVVASIMYFSIILMPLALVVFYSFVVPVLLASAVFVYIYGALNCQDSDGNKLQSKIPTLDTEELLKLAKKANAK